MFHVQNALCCFYIWCICVLFYVIFSSCHVILINDCANKEYIYILSIACQNMSLAFATFSPNNISTYTRTCFLPKYFWFRRQKNLFCWPKNVNKYAYKSIIQMRRRISPASTAILRAEAKRRHYHPLNCCLESANVAHDKRSKINLVDSCKGPLIVLLIT